MTISSGDNADMDSEEEASYQIELEIMKPDAVDDIYKFFNIINKVSDLSKLISVSKYVVLQVNDAAARTKKG